MYNDRLDLIIIIKDPFSRILVRMRYKTLGSAVRTKYKYVYAYSQGVITHMQPGVILFPHRISYEPVMERTDKNTFIRAVHAGI